MKKIYMILFALMAVLNASATDFYLVGAFNSWDVKSDACKFTETSTSGVYELNYTGTLVTSFKITDGSWSGSYNIGSNGSKLVKGTAYSYSNSGSSGNIEIDEAIANPTLTLDVNAGTLLITGDKAEVEVTYVLDGSFADGTNWSLVSMTDAGNGVWTVSGIESKDAKFLVEKQEDGSSTSWYGTADVTTVSQDVELTLVSDNKNDISIAAGTYDFSLDTSTMKLTVKKVDTTGISAIAAESATDAPAYNLAGQRVNKGAKGLVIVNGKKYLNK